MSKLEKIQNEILSLSTEERELIGIFVRNTQVPDAGYHEAWQSELQKRLNEVKDQSVNLASTKSVIADMRKEQL